MTTLRESLDLVQVRLSWGKKPSSAGVKKCVQYKRKEDTDELGAFASAPKYIVRFFLQFLQATFEMLQMSQIRLSLLFSRGKVEPSL